MNFFQRDRERATANRTTKRFNEVCTRKPLSAIHRRCFKRHNWIKDFYFKAPAWGRLKESELRNTAFIITNYKRLCESQWECWHGKATRMRKLAQMERCANCYGWQKGQTNVEFIGGKKISKTKYEKNFLCAFVEFFSCSQKSRMLRS